MADNTKLNMASVQHVFVIGSKSIGQYGGYETFVDKLTEQHQNDPTIKYHIACKANGDGFMDESKLDGVEITKKNSDGSVAEFTYHNAHVFKIPCPNIGPAVAIYYDRAAVLYSINYCKPSFDHIKNVTAVTKLALDVDDGRGFITYPANSAVHLKRSSITKSDPDIRLKVVEVQLSDGTLSTDMDTYNGFRFYATTGKCIIDSEDNGTRSYPDADQIGHFKFADGVANDETTLMAYNQATLKYKYLMVYVED